MHSIPLIVYILAYRVSKGLCWNMLEHLERPTAFSSVMTCTVKYSQQVLFPVTLSSGRIILYSEEQCTLLK